MKASRGRSAMTNKQGWGGGRNLHTKNRLPMCRKQLSPQGAAGPPQSTGALQRESETQNWGSCPQFSVRLGFPEEEAPNIRTNAQ